MTLVQQWVKLLKVKGLVLHQKSRLLRMRMYNSRLYLVNIKFVYKTDVIDFNNNVLLKQYYVLQNQLMKIFRMILTKKKKNISKLNLRVSNSSLKSCENYFRNIKIMFCFRLEHYYFSTTTLYSLWSSSRFFVT